ncbi:MAG: nicotinate (nicotinamide) nucleotide adenylyltransferase [Planctomycetota bacterium]
MPLTPADFNASHTLLLFGGSFDPPHRAHADLPHRVAEHLGADAVVYIPARRPPHKPDRVLADDHHRLAMLQLTLEHGNTPVPRLLWTGELQRTGPSYTVDTLEQLHTETPATLRLLIGTDHARVFNTWRQHDRIFALAEPAVMVRPPDTIDNLAAELPAGWSHRLIPPDIAPHTDISSTAVRDRLRRGQPIDDLVPEPVAHYIAEHRLYTPQE